jgi:hypothetical protein
VTRPTSHPAKRIREAELQHPGDLPLRVFTVMSIRRSSRLTVDAIGIECGETNPTLGSLATIARTLKIATSKLLEGAD